MDMDRQPPYDTRNPPDAPIVTKSIDEIPVTIDVSSWPGRYVLNWSIVWTCQACTRAFKTADCKSVERCPWCGGQMTKTA